MKRRLLALALLLATAPAGAEAASVSCVVATEQQLRARAQVIFVGVALAGDNATGTLLSPARFRVVRYVKGRGGRIVRVTTATRREGDGYSAISIGINPRVGERWRIYGRRNSSGVIVTSACDGSRRLTP